VGAHANFDAYWEYSPAFRVVPAGRRTLEVGCGEGRVTRDLVKRGHRVTSCDSTFELLKLAAEADKTSGYLRCDAAAWPFPDESFDLAVYYNSLMDIDEIESSVREAARVLAPGGRMCACVTHSIPDSASSSPLRTTPDLSSRAHISATGAGSRSQWSGTG
jgi:ubiquinone/menaquinone biosynthesis C-methylase UbiE